jgi:hypothetical protein
LRLEENGNVRVFEIDIVDGGGKVLTLRIGSYTKSVSFGSSAGPIPGVLGQLAREIESLVPTSAAE